MNHEIEKYPETQKWYLSKRKGTLSYYQSALKAYCDFMGLNPTQIIDSVEEDRKKSARQRGGPERKLLEFHSWLLKNYKMKNGKVGVSTGLAGVYCNAIKSFYRDNGFPLNIRLPKGTKRKENQKISYRAEEVAKLLSVASLRDRAIILMMFQSGMGVGELCGVNYGDVQKELDEGTVPLHLHLIREKTKVEYDTFIAEEAIEALRLYLSARERSGERLQYNSPLFIKEGKSKKDLIRIEEDDISAAFRNYTVKAGLVSPEQLKVADVNPARPHALRAAFVTILKVKGANDTAVEYMQGHQLDGTVAAYWSSRVEELRELYSKYMPELQVYNKIPNERMTSKIEFERLTKQVKKLHEQLDLANLVYPRMIMNVIEQLEPEKRENLNELYTALKEKVKD